jgi:hypothetical protein
MLYSHPFDNLEERLAKPFAIVCVIESREANESTLELPFSGYFFDPVRCDRKIAISIACLPSIAGQANFALHGRTLKNGGKGVRER